jgi:hypothetical protein
VFFEMKRRRLRDTSLFHFFQVITFLIVMRGREKGLVFVDQSRGE